MRPQRVVDRDALVVDFLGVADHARHGAEAAGHAHGSGIGEGGQPALEHARVELVGLAVDVDETAREMRPHQRIALRHHAGDQGVDETVLGAPQGADIEPRNPQEFARIDRAAMRRIEQHRAAAGGRFHDLEGRIELFADFTHGTTSSGRVSVEPWQPCEHAIRGWRGRRPPYTIYCPWWYGQSQAMLLVHPLFTGHKSYGGRKGPAVSGGRDGAVEG